MKTTFIHLGTFFVILIVPLLLWWCIAAPYGLVYLWFILYWDWWQWIEKELA